MVSFKNLRWLLAATLLLSTTITEAASLSKSSLTLVKGKSSDIKVSNIKGIATLDDTNEAIVSASLMTAGKKGQLTITALSPGRTKLLLRDGRGVKTIQITVKPALTLSAAALTLTVNQSAAVTLSNASGKVRLSNDNAAVASAALAGNTISVKGKAVGTSLLTVKDSLTSLTLPVTVIATPPNVSVNSNGRLLASNCFQCHGTNGSGGFDAIAGKSDLNSELREYLNGSEDPDGIMAAHLKGYTAQQLQAIADYLANP